MSWATLLHPAVIERLVKLGISTSREVREAARLVDTVLQEKYRFDRPRWFFGLNAAPMFRSIRRETVGARQFVLERGRLVGRFYRIRERRGIFPLTYFSWGTYDSEDEALDHWEGFVALMKAKEALRQVTGASSSSTTPRRARDG